MGSGLHDAAARGFPGAAAAYEEGRPTYPPKAVARLARELHLGVGRAVLDLAAGTGKLTALLVGTGAKVVAVEPVPEMRAVLERALPGVPALSGTAEAIPLGSATVDAVCAGQAFHWFRGDEALREIHRVLKPGGRLLVLDHVRSPIAPVRWIQRTIEPLVASYAGWHLTRDPLDYVESTGFTVESCSRSRLGMIEELVARKN